MEKEVKEFVSDGKEALMNIYEKLSHIQNELKAPKNLYNTFGKYNYRNAESILEASKPICMKYRATCLVTDAIVYVEGRFYVEATARLYDWDSDKTIEAKADAREVEVQKGMDGAQITGSSSSYARKYALNGLFNLDDNKDADTDEQHIEKEAKAKKQQNAEIESLKKDIEQRKETLQKLGVNLDAPQINKWIEANCHLTSQEFNPKNLAGMKNLLKGYNTLINAKQKN